MTRASSYQISGIKLGYTQYEVNFRIDFKFKRCIMTVFQCRCCGAVLEVNTAKTYCECSFCGVTQTVPILDFDEKTILWERADNLRRGGEYDRAMAVYDQLAELCPDDPDIYWSKTLCRYGVEYVEENGSHKRVPTLNRIQYESVVEDENYRKAVELADDGRQRVYIIWAKQLEELRRNILAVTLAEKPYDIFICYKETDGNGRRTEDSVIAAQMYRNLTAEGWRVFFSRVTLEDKAGTAFEPYIFAALNSAKIMLAVGTKPEHFNAVWTRNEWSRFLALTDGDPEKTLAVLYKGMLPAQLPEEFAHLRRFDISDPDFYEELMRGVRKTLKTSVSRDTQEQAQREQPIESADASSLLRRARLFLEDRMFERADELCEQALNLDPENADGYLVKLLAECRLSSEDVLGSYYGDFTRSGNYAKAIRFGDDEFTKRLQGYAKSSSYETYCLELKNAVNESQLEAIAKRFDALDYADSAEKADAAREKADELRREYESRDRAAKYRNAMSIYNANCNSAAQNDNIRMENLSIALDILTKLSGYENSEQIIADIRAEQDEINERREQENALMLARQKRKQKLEGRVFRAVLIAVPVCAAIIIAVNVIGGAQLKSKYNAASELLSVGKYEEAAAAFAAMGDYSDSAERVIESHYRQAVSLLESGSYDKAKELFGEMAGYSDSNEQMLRADYLKAVSLGENGDFKSAAELFNKLNGYLDSKERANDSLYEYARSVENSDFGEAAELYKSLGSHKDSAERYLLCAYENAERLFESGDLVGAFEAFKALENYSDSAERTLKCGYIYAVSEAESGSLAKAENMFSELGDYNDSAERLVDVKYKLAVKNFEDGKYESASNRFRSLGSYLDSRERRDESEYAYAEQLAADGNYQKAISVIRWLHNYKDSEEKKLEYNYKLAEQMLVAGLYKDAKFRFEEAGNFSDAPERAAEMQRLIFAKSKVGDYLNFGEWRQGIGGSIGSLEWLVLERSGTRALLVTRDLVEAKPFGGYNWAESELRIWLNGEFLSKAFTDKERGAICETTLQNPDNNPLGTYGGGDTVDSVFLLSDTQAKKYFETETQREAKFSDWCKAQLGSAAQSDSRKGDKYWLRSVGYTFCIDSVNSNGTINEHELYSTKTNGVRPAVWIEVGE